MGVLFYLPFPELCVHLWVSLILCDSEYSNSVFVCVCVELSGGL